MKKLLLVVALVGFVGVAAEKSADEHNAKSDEKTEKTSTADKKNQAPAGLSQEKLAKLNQMIQACSVNRPAQAK